MTWVLLIGFVAVIIVIAGVAENHRGIVWSGLALGCAACWAAAGVGVHGLLT